MQQRNAATLPKRIIFYQVIRRERPVQGPGDFDFETIFARIGGMPFTTEGRELADGADGAITCYPDAPRAVRFGRIRKRNLPSRVDGARVDDVPVAPGGGLLETTHVVYFPDHGIIGAEFNFHAPRMSRLAGYIGAKAQVRDVEIVPILKKNAVDDLRRFRSLHSIDLKVATTFPQGRRRLPLFTAIAEAGAVPGVETVEFRLVAKQGRNYSLGRSLEREILGLADLPNVAELADKFLVSGYKGDETRLDVVDVLKDELVAVKQFVKESVRGARLDSADAYEKIAQAYRDIEPWRYVGR